jgi:hypothetical protein
MGLLSAHQRHRLPDDHSVPVISRKRCVERTDCAMHTSFDRTTREIRRTER